MKPLTIHNIANLRSHFRGSDWDLVHWDCNDIEYRFELIHKSMMSKAVFVLSRKPLSTTGEPHYNTYVEGNGFGRGSVSHNFLKDPANLMQQIIISIER